MRPRPPPVVALALAFGAGCALVLSRVVPPTTLLPAALVLVPIWPFLRPGHRILVAALAVSFVAGSLRTAAWQDREGSDCRLQLPEGPVGTVTGRFLGRPGEGATAFRVEDGFPGGCRGRVRAYTGTRDSNGPATLAPPGQRLRARGTWRPLPPRGWVTPERAGYLVLDDVEIAEERGLEGGVLRVRGRVQVRLSELFGDRAAVTEALVLARKERLDPALRDAFARAGIAHLLAISGFHVGIVAGLILSLARLGGAGPRRSPALAAAGAWTYVLAIGSPDAAVRASLLLSLLAAGPVRTRPVAPLGALGSALLFFLVVDPAALGRAGFQLSFAGTAGLILWSRPLSAEIRAMGGGRTPGWLASGLAAGLAATGATLPLVAWHFGEVPLLGVPVTLILGPLVALAIPGIFAALAVGSVLPGAGAFLAGGTGLLLEGVVRGAEWTASLAVSSAWVSRPGLLLGVAGGIGGWIVAVAVGLVSRWERRALLTAGVAAGLVGGPLVGATTDGGSIEVVAVDVGQGDALAVRSPAGRWVLVDTGPRSHTFDAGRRRVIPYLRRRGVSRLEAVVLTHPDLDHIGGAPAVLEAIEVAGVLDPGRAAARAAFEEVLEVASARGVGWWPASERQVLELDGMEIEVLFPPSTEVTGDANDASVVLLLRYGRFRALLTGDAPASVEREILSAIDEPVQVLKVGHHGSITSTSRALLESLRPELAVIPVGWRNRYGHPDPRVLDRLEGAGSRIYRTDLHGTVVVRGRADGSWSVMLPDR